MVGGLIRQRYCKTIHLYSRTKDGFYCHYSHIQWLPCVEKRDNVLPGPWCYIGTGHYSAHIQCKKTDTKQHKVQMCMTCKPFRQVQVFIWCMCVCVSTRTGVMHVWACMGMSPVTVGWEACWLVQRKCSIVWHWGPECFGIFCQMA